ncbi:MAG: Gfo/Idh/MocA family oxidoreductase [Candidatus Poribacteria bacterium]|nr:Gfo/Idh/MocA family oxidoreductase [Candidatus Poribacteria bacterium]
MTTEPKQNVRWGILSTANIATKVSRAINLASGSELMAVASRTEERAKSWAAEHRVDRAYGSYAALLDDPDIDAIYIPLPPSMHAEWTIKAAEHGKHVLCEKPLATNAEEAATMADACRRNHVQLMDGLMWVHHNRTAAMKQIIGNDTLGRLRRVTAAFTFNWDTIPEDNIRAKKELGGSSLGDLGYYCVRAILWAYGALPTQVFATARYHRNVDMNLSGLLWYEDERMGAFDCGFDTGSRKWFEVAGTKASLVCDDFAIPWKEDSSRFWVHGAQGKDAEHKSEGCIQEVNMIERFSDIVRSGQLEFQWPTDAVNTMRVCDALHESARRGQIITL